jgi:tetratricopeptide (TPR) repeat protein
MIEFTQSFGHGNIDASKCLENDWHIANLEAEKAVRAFLPKEVLHKRDENYRKWADHPIGPFMHMGTGWGALECARLKKVDMNLPPGIPFVTASLSKDQLPWLRLLDEGVLPCHAPGQIAPWLTGKYWLNMLEYSVLYGGGKHWESLLHLGVMMMEAGDLDDARTAWEESLTLCKAPVTLRNLACYHQSKGDLKKAIHLMEQALDLPDSVDPAYMEEFLELLIADGQHQAAWDQYHRLPEPKRTDRSLIAISVAALALGQNDYLIGFFARELASVKEGDNILTDVWFRWQAHLLDMTEAQARVDLKPPAHIDFRMNNLD